MSLQTELPAAPSPLQAKFGQSLRECRRSRNLSQEQLADLARLNRNYLGEIERGLVSPSLATLEKLAGALQLSVSQLLAHTESAPGEREPD